MASGQRKSPGRRRRAEPSRARVVGKFDRHDFRGEATDPATLDTPRARVWYLARLMASGLWKPKRQVEFAAIWKLERMTVRRMAAEASRILDITINDRAQLLKLMQARLVEISDQDGPDRVQALRTLYEHLGELRQRQELSGPDGAPIEMKGSTQLVILPAKEWLDGDDGDSDAGEDTPGSGHNGNGHGPEEH